MILPETTTPEIGKQFSYHQTAAGAEKKSKNFNIALSDRDSDRLYLRPFVNGFYDQWIRDLSTTGCTKEGCGFVFSIVGLCDEVVNNVLAEHVIEVYVSDLAWADEDKNDLRKLQEGAFGVNLFWRFLCLPPEVETSDGGA